MNREDIIRWARKAGCLSLDELSSYDDMYDVYTRFAAFVAAASIEKMIPELAELWDEKPSAIMFDDMRRIAADIRARGQQ